MRINIDLPQDYTDLPRETIRGMSESIVSGVYIFYDVAKIPLYVGKTIDRKRRLMVHASSSPFFQSSDFVRFYEVSEMWKVDVLESYLIHELKPEYNIDKTFYTEEDIAFMVKRIDDKLAFYNRRKVALNELLTEDGTDIYDPSDIIAAERTLENVRSEISNLRLRRTHVLKRIVGAHTP